MISKDEVKHIARLAKIEISESQVEKYQQELSAILDFVGQLNKLDTTGVEPIRQITGLESVFRKDEVESQLGRKSGEELMGQAPESKNGFVVVPQIIKK